MHINLLLRVFCCRCGHLKQEELIHVSCLPLHLFFRFMDNLQTEVLEIEFLTYSKGMTTISEEDFAKILLRFTNVENISAYLENVRHSIPDEKVAVKTNVTRCFIIIIFESIVRCCGISCYN